MRSRPFVLLLAWLALLVGQVAPAAANDLTRSVTSGDIAVNFGVVPANQTAAAGGSAASSTRQAWLRSPSGQTSTPC